MNDLQGASFTISSLGAIGGTGFTPIINAPEVAILGVSRLTMQAALERQRVRTAADVAAVAELRSSSDQWRRGRTLCDHAVSDAGGHAPHSAVSLALGPWPLLPEQFRRADVEHAREHEQRVAESIQEHAERRVVVVGSIAHQLPHTSFRAPADGPGEVRLRTGGRAAGQNEIGERAELRRCTRATNRSKVERFCGERERGTAASRLRRRDRTAATGVRSA